MKATVRATLAAGVLAMASLSAGVTPVLAGCGINVKYVNHDSKKATVQLFDSKVRVKKLGIWGTWSKLGNGSLSVLANSHKSQTYNLDLGCNYDRQYKFYVQESGNSKTLYKPSASGSTRNTNLTVDINF